MLGLLDDHKCDNGVKKGNFDLEYNTLSSIDSLDNCHGDVDSPFVRNNNDNGHMEGFIDRRIDIDLDCIAVNLGWMTWMASMVINLLELVMIADALIGS